MVFLPLILLLAAAVSGSGLPISSTVKDAEGYLERLRSRVESHWQHPPVAGNLEAKVKFNLDRAGHVWDMAIAKSSGRPDFDSSVLQAIKRASPFPPIPEHLMNNAKLRAVEITFNVMSDAPETEREPKSLPPQRQLLPKEIGAAEI